MLAHVCVCVNVCIVLRGVAAEHFLGGSCATQILRKKNGLLLHSLGRLGGGCFSPLIKPKCVPR